MSEEIDWMAALEIVVKRTNCQKFREMTADSNPTHEAWRAKVVLMAEPWRPVDYPAVFGRSEDTPMAMVEASSTGDQAPPPPRARGTPMPAAIAAPGGGVRPIPAAESAQLVKEMNACEHRINTSNAGCGCATCGLGKGNRGTVSHRDCFKCLRPGDPRFA